MRPHKIRKSAQTPPKMEAVKTVERSLSAPSHKPKVATSLTSPPPIPFLVRNIKAKKKVPAKREERSRSIKGRSKRREKKIPDKAKGSRIISKMIYCSKSVMVMMSRKIKNVVWYRF